VSKMLSRVTVALMLALPSGGLAQQQPPVVEAHPALWTVHSRDATAYLLGSIHLLPPNVHWQTPQIEAAMKSADVFVFEVPIDQAATKQISEYIAKNGMLPQGVTLPSLLSPQQKKDYDTALEVTGVNPATVIDKRPWLASLVFDMASATHANYSLDSGVDHQVQLYADTQRRPIDSFETVADQLALLTPKSRELEIKEFDVDLKEIVSDPDQLTDLVDAWERGDAKGVAELMNSALADDPAAAKTLIDDRNAKWVAELKAMMQRKHIYFITVGAGHLAGIKGVPALMRAAGYNVEGP
jgi:uncharacterized protein